jgi:hypothetical protein
MYLIFRCSCGRHLYAPEDSKSRTCPCGKRSILAKVRVLARAEDALAAGTAVRTLQLGGRQMTGFHSADKKKEL